MQVSRERGWTNTWSLSLSSFRPLPEDMQPLIAYRVRGYAANPSAPRTCCPARRSHASGRVFQVHEPAGVFSVHISRRVQRNPVNGVGQNSSTEPARSRFLRMGSGSHTPAISSTTTNTGMINTDGTGRIFLGFGNLTSEAFGIGCLGLL